MAAGNTTWSFKVAVIEILERSGVGYDTKFRYYRGQFPDMDRSALARRVCDPIEFYDREWPVYRDRRPVGEEEEQSLTRFVAERDALCRNQARAAIYCYDEAGLGSGVNSMRFLSAGKPILGFLNEDPEKLRVNVQNVLQLSEEYPQLVTLIRYKDLEQVGSGLLTWLGALVE